MRVARSNLATMSFVTRPQPVT